MTPFSLSLILTGVGLNALAQFLLKMATNRTGELDLSHTVSAAGLSALFLQGPMIAGLLCYGISLLVWLMALSRTEVSLAYPMLSIGYVLNALAAQQWLGETIGLQRWCAIGVICLGVAWLARS